MILRPGNMFLMHLIQTTDQVQLLANFQKQLQEIPPGKPFIHFSGIKTSYRDTS